MNGETLRMSSAFALAYKVLTDARVVEMYAGVSFTSGTGEVRATYASAVDAVASAATKARFEEAMMCGE